MKFYDMTLSHRKLDFATGLKWETNFERRKFKTFSLSE